MKKFLIALALLIGGLQCSNTLAKEESKRYIVRTKSTDNKLKSARSRRLETLNTSKGKDTFVINLTASELEEYKKNSNIDLIEEDVKVSLVSQTESWALSSIKIDNARADGLTGKGVKIAVLDSGVTKHDDLNIIDGVAFTSYTTSYEDDNGHGTHVTGIIGALDNDIGTVGVAPDAKLYIVKVLDSKGDGYISDVIEGVNWAIQNDVDIINLSLGTPVNSAFLQETLEFANSKGIIIVVAAGNKGNTQGAGDNILYPAKYDCVLSVGAVDSNHQRSLTSSTGNKLDLVAPGGSIMSTYLNNQYAVIGGTSMAAPHVTGVIALLKEAYPYASSDWIKARLIETVEDLGEPGKDRLYGYGLVQIPDMNPDTPVLYQPVLHLNKSTYAKEETVEMNIFLIGPSGELVKDAKVNVTLVHPNSKLSGTVQRTGENGKLTLLYEIPSDLLQGTYQVNVTITHEEFSTNLSTVFYIN